MTRDSRPRLAAKARLRVDRITHQRLLLSPERGLLLNGTAGEIVQRCTGEQTVAAIVDGLANRYSGLSRDLIEHEVLIFLHELVGLGVLSERC